MKYVDALSRRNRISMALIKEADLVQCIQNEDDDCQLIKKKLKDGNAEECNTMNQKCSFPMMCVGE